MHISFTFILLFLLNNNFCYSQPKNESNLRKPELVELIKLDSTFHLDIRYATTNNFVGQPVYKQARAFLQRPAADALVRVNKKLKEYGFGLLIFDGYRPWSVTKLFWDSATEEERLVGFVADPAKGSRHNRGCAVDLSLYNLATGKEVTMPSSYDEFNEKAYYMYEGGDPEVRGLRDLLINTMESEDFKVLETEWWHFDYKDWQLYPILNINFEELK
ncbi:MAG: M15 family metallopeptidase [Ignavibacteria bacterium]|nr:M15 family metallopeptidase [Ignavibacteria bacterium]